MGLKSDFKITGLGKMRKIKSTPFNKVQIPRIEVRRSSSFQIPTTLSLQPIDDSKLSEVSALTPSSSFFSVLSHHSSQLNLEMNMSRNRCCFDTCRIRVGACAIGVGCIIISILALCFLLSFSSGMTSEAQSLLTPPIILALSQFATAMIMIVAVLTSFHYLLVPFMATCVFNILGLVVLCSWAVVRRSTIPSPFFPIILFGSAAGSILYLWFLTITSMTFSLIRDRKIMGYDDGYNIENRNLDRASSSIV